MEALVRALVAIFLAMEQVQRDPSACEMLDREMEDVFAILSALKGSELLEIRHLVEAIRTESQAQYVLDGIDLLLRNLPRA